MKVTNKIKKAFSDHSKVNTKRLELQHELYSWVAKQGIDVTDVEFADAIGIRISEDEFRSFEEFIEDVRKYKNGEHVGY
ncbi:Uncharacterised protein [Lysinibacillus sphaericus]|nr:Uncharacterised protein [Lysinibacillus sphaericus]